MELVGASSEFDEKRQQCAGEGELDRGRTGERIAKATVGRDFDPSRAVEVGVEHELKVEGDVILVEVELGVHDGSAAKHLREGSLEARIDEVDLEVGLVADLVAVDGNTLANEDEGDVLRWSLLLLVALLLGEVHRAVERHAELEDVGVHCGERGQTCDTLLKPVPDSQTSGLRLPLYST